MLCIADYTNNNGVAWPSISTIAEKTKVSPRQVSRAISSMVALGELVILEKGNGRGKSTTYKINLPFEQIKDDISSIKDDTMTSFNEESTTVKGDISSIKDDMVSKKDDMVSSEPLITIKEPKDNRQIVLQAYQNNIGSLTIGLEKSLYAAVDTYSLPWVIDAILEAKKRGVYKWAYIQTILKNWQVEGRGGRQPQNGSGPNPGEEAWRRVMGCVRKGKWSLPKESLETKVIKESFNWPDMLRATEKDLSFLAPKFIKAFNDECNSHT